ncbi:MAG: hypothetical protein H0V17_36575 [Deltaproteobacteria bacterium]|nr:hypothetical protein [Deltaproteobacteria bacterium]
MKTIATVTATDNTISITDLSRVTGGVAPSTNCKDGGCIPSPFPRPFPSPFPRPRPFPFPGPDPINPRPFDSIFGGDKVRR